MLDPFAGSGRTLETAGNYGRHGLGIDLNPDYLPRAQEICGMYLETHSSESMADWLRANKMKFQPAD